MSPVALFTHTTQGDRLTGGPRMIHTLLRGLRDGPFRPRFLTQRESDLTLALRDDGVEVDILPLPSGLDVFGGELARPNAAQAFGAALAWLEYHQTFADFLARTRPSIVWASNLRTLLPISVATHRARIPLVWNIWLGQRSRGMLSLLNDAGIHAADRIVTEYAAQAEDVFSPGQQARARAKLRTVYTGHAIGLPPTRALRAAEAPLVVGTLGALSPRKNPRAFLEMAARVRAAFPAARFRIGGDIVAPEFAAFRDELRALAASDPSECVEWCGWTDDPRAFLAQLDVYVQTSRAEGLPGAVREAMALGIPVVATDVGGTKEAVIDRETGYLTAADDIEALASAVLRLARDPELAGRLGRAGRERFERLFAVQPFVRGTLAVLAELVPGVIEPDPIQSSRESHSDIART